MRKDLHQEDGHSSDLDQKRSGISTHESKPRREWDRVSELMMMKFSESGHPVFWSTSPLLQGVLRGSTSGGKLSIHFCADEGTIETVLRTIISGNQLSIYAAVSDLCEKYKSCHVRTGRLVVARQSDPLFVPKRFSTKTLTPSCARRSTARVTKNECQDYHNKIVWLRIVLMQDSWQRLTSDSISWRKMLQNSHNSQMQWLAVSTLCQETKKHLNPKGWIRVNTKLGPVLEVTTCCLQSKSGVEIRIMSLSEDNSHSWVRISHGFKKLVTNLSNNEEETSEVQSEDYALKTNALVLQADQRPKQNHKDEILPALPEEPYLLGKEFGPMLNQENIQSPIMKCRRNQFIFFVMEVYIEKTMERLNSGESKTILRNSFFVVIIGLTTSGRKAWQEEEETRKYTIIVLIHQEQSCTSERFKVIQDAVSLILLYKTMSWFRATSSNTLIMSDVQSVYIPSSIRDWYLEVKFWATDRQYSFCLWIPWTKKTINILIRSTWRNRVMHNTCIKHGRSIKIWCIGSTSILLWRKNWSSIKHDRTLSFFTKNFQLIVFRKLFGMETGEVIYEKVYASPRPKTWMDERIGFRSCSTTGWTSCLTI